MRLLVIGLGSMGKRRVRNLLALGHTDVAGFDPRIDRRSEAQEKYRITVYGSFEAALEQHRPEALVISTPPDCHMAYAWRGFDLKLPCFIEASVVGGEEIKELSEAVRRGGLVMAPSCTTRYCEGPRMVKKLLTEQVIGKPLNFNFQTGQYLPDWHPWEDIQDFYVSQRKTGGCREIVPFELTWLNDIFGRPNPVACLKAKVTDIPAQIDDIYHCLLKYPEGVLGNLTVEVVSRPNVTRELRVLGANGQLVWSADENCVRYATVENPDWTRIKLGLGTVESGYINPEEPYIAEMADFLAAASSGDCSLYPNTLEDDWAVLQTLYDLEKLSGDEI